MFALGNEIDSLCHKISSLFKHSSKCKYQIQEIQKKLYNKKYVYKNFCKTRWLSRYESI